MNKEEKNIIIKKLAEERNNYCRDCERRIATENGKITGADYMIYRLMEIINNEEEE